MRHRVNEILTLVVAAVSLCFVLATVALAEKNQTPDYNRDVRPILSENCFACHGFNEEGREADLRLDLADSAYEDRGDYAAIVPGNADASELWKRIVSNDEAEQMPPPDSHKQLTAEQKETLRLWIDQGAAYEKHWAFIPPRKSPLPTVATPPLPQSEIDTFVRARLQQEQLVPAPKADRWTLVRRVTLDLTGLPPTAEETNAFVMDSRPDAFERLVDRLLASPHFGERMALDWLDAARYADTNGYSIDGGRHMWLWRDWVIDAFNRNLPYDQFLRDQLAGDLLPDHTEAQLIATGFQRNNMVTHEGGTIPEENLMNYNADRVKTLGESVLGLTIGCAQCHDHKYDPISQRDYYRLFAYFNTVSDIGLDGNSGVNPRPSHTTQTVLRTKDLPAIREQIAAIRAQLASPDPIAQVRWEDQQRQKLQLREMGLQLHPTQLLTISTPNRGAGFEIEADRYASITQKSSRLAYDLSLKMPSLAEPMTGYRVVFHPAENMPGKGWGFGKLSGSAEQAAPERSTTTTPDKGTFVVSALSASAESVSSNQVNLHQLLPISKVTASSFDSRYPPGDVLDTRKHNGWAPQSDSDGSVHITLTMPAPLDTRVTPYLTVQVNFSHGANLVAGRFEVLVMTGEDDGTLLPREVIDSLQLSAEQRTAEQANLLATYFSSHSKATEPLRIELANLEERLQVFSKKYPTMVMAVAEKPRDTFILVRGSYASPGEKVTAGTPTVLPVAPGQATADRLELANWVTMPENPLTSRVAVNRIWQLFFGAGIVKSTVDFGSQGEWPSHPELLDWLAVDFMESGWNVKSLVRKIVISATYRQSAVASPGLLAKDPGNRLLARGPRFRLQAEFIRDQALQVSGLLVPWVGGPSVNPYTPGDLWREVSHYGSSPATAQSFVQDHGSKLYRRSIYTYWKRTVPPPNMVAFDAPNREVCVVKRAATTTPLQALVLLNDVQFVECARVLAERMLAAGSDDTARIRWAFRECLSRPPFEEELAVLLATLERERKRYAAEPDEAAAFLTNGESPRNETIAAEEHAAWSQVATVLLNLSETVTRN